MPRRRVTPRIPLPMATPGPISRPGVTPPVKRGMGIRRERPIEPPRRRLGMGTPPVRTQAVRPAIRPPIVKNGRTITTAGRRRERRRRAS